MKPSLKSDLSSLAALRDIDLQAVDGPARAQGLGKQYDDIVNHAINSAFLAQIEAVGDANATAQRAMETLKYAEEAMSSIKKVIQRMYSLATENANCATLSDRDRWVNERELDALHGEVDRIVACASCRGQRLLAGEYAVQLRFHHPSSGDNGSIFSLSLPNLGTPRGGLELNDVSIHTVRDALTTCDRLATARETLERAQAAASALRRQIGDAVRESNLRFLADASRGWVVDHVDLYDNPLGLGPGVPRPKRLTMSTLRDGLQPPSSPGARQASCGP